MKFLAVILSFTWSVTCFSQTEIQAESSSINSDADKTSSVAPDIDNGDLNTCILMEINELRKKAKVPLMSIDEHLKGPADEHVNYMCDKSKLTHKEHSKYKKNPKNRVDGYGHHFKNVNENVLVIDLQNAAFLKLVEQNKKKSYNEVLAKQIVSIWTKSSANLKVLLLNEFVSTYTSIRKNERNQLYICQLLGSAYFDYPPEVKDSSLYQYKPEKAIKCLKCGIFKRASYGSIAMDENRNLYFIGAKGFKPFFARRVAYSNPWHDGMAADIVLKPQYSCQDGIILNGMANVDGIPLDPVFRKDFGKGPGQYGIFNTQIYLGKVPEWVDEEFEVNLTVVNKKRTCSSTKYHVIPIYLGLDLQIKMEVHADSIIIRKQHFDTIENKIIYAKGKIDFPPMLRDSIRQQISAHHGTPTHAILSGFASIEGSKKLNEELFYNRATNMKQFLDEMQLDSSKIITEMSENFDEFRQDIHNTPYSYLDTLSDSELKQRLERSSLSDSLEFILKNHRYSTLTLYFEWEERPAITKDTVNHLFENAVNNNKVRTAENLQEMQLDFILAGEMTVEELDTLSIPFDKKYENLLNNRAIIHYLEDSLNPERLDNLNREIKMIVELDPKDVVLNTNIAKIDYLSGSYFTRKQIHKFSKRKYVNKTAMARILIMMCYNHDISMLKASKKRSMYNFAKKYVRNADLSVEETFEFSRYLAYERDYQAAYLLVKPLIKKTDSPENLVYFLKLIYLNNVKISHDELVQLFKRVKKHSRQQYCTYFNTPALNFQILEDPDLMEIYCDECSNWNKNE